MWQQHQHCSIPGSSGSGSTLHQTSSRLGSYSSRSDTDTVTSTLEDIQARLKKVSLNVIETRDEFESLSDRSKDNGAALESLMAEIKSFVAISNTHHTNQVRELARLNQLDQLKKLEHLDKLANHVRDLELQQRELNARMDLWKKFDEDGLFDQIKELNTIPAKLKSLEKLNNLDQLKTLADLKGAVDSLKSEKQVPNQIQHLGDQLVEKNNALVAAVDRVARQLDQLGQKTNQANSEADKNLLEALNAKLDTSDTTLLLNQILSKLERDDNSKQLQGEVRAIQDHLLGEHDSTRKELEELRRTAHEQAAELERFHSLHQSEEALLDKVQKLQQQEKVLLAHNTQLKTELKLSAQSLAAAESRYRELESHVREVMISKYQAAVETTSMAKESSIIIPKRRSQNRSVSLQNS